MKIELGTIILNEDKTLELNITNPVLVDRFEVVEEESKKIMNETVEVIAVNIQRILDLSKDIENIVGEHNE